MYHLKRALRPITGGAVRFREWVLRTDHDHGIRAVIRDANTPMKTHPRASGTTDEMRSIKTGHDSGALSAGNSAYTGDCNQ